MFKKTCALLSCIATAGCSYLGSDINSIDSYPKSWEERQLEEMGKLTGEDGIVLFGGKSRSNSAATQGINVNSYLWRASLDTIYKMPIISADPFGGVIITDWHQATHSKERFKVTIYIIGDELRSDALRVTVFKQVSDKKGHWSDQRNASALATEIENKILLRAREIKYKSTK